MFSINIVDFFYLSLLAFLFTLRRVGLPLGCINNKMINLQFHWIAISQRHSKSKSYFVAVLKTDYRMCVWIS